MLNVDVINIYIYIMHGVYEGVMEFIQWYPSNLFSKQSQIHFARK